MLEIEKRFEVLKKITRCPFCGERGFDVIVSEPDFTQEQIERESLKTTIYTQPIKLTYVQYYPTSLCQCRKCGLVFREQRPFEEDLEKAYQKDFMPTEYRVLWENSWLPIFNRILGKIEKIKPSKGKILDIGSQFGFFPYLASLRGWQAEGVDPNEHTQEIAKQRGIFVYPAVFSKISKELVAPYSVITALTAFENLPNFVDDTKAIYDLLEKGGVFVMKVCNFDFYSRYRNFFLHHDLGKIILMRLHLMGYPYQFGFTHSFLKRFLNSFGFQEILIQPYQLSISKNPSLTLKTKFLERFSKGSLNLLAKLQMNERKQSIAPWFEVYAIK